MTKALEFYFDYISPYSHIANAAVKKLKARTGAVVEIKPMFLGAVMQGTGNRPPGMVPAKNTYMLADLQRCAGRYGLTVRMNPYFHLVSTRDLLRATIGLAGDPAEQQRFIDACFRYIWETPEALKPDDDASVKAMCDAEGFDFAEIKRLANDDACKAAMCLLATGPGEVSLLDIWTGLLRLPLLSYSRTTLSSSALPYWHKLYR